MDHFWLKKWVREKQKGEKGNFFDRIGVVKIKKQSRREVNNTLKMWQLWGTPLFSSSASSLLIMVEDQIDTNQNKPFWIATVNTEFVIEAQKDRQFFELLKKTSLNVMDGIGLVWAKLVQEGRNWIVAGTEILGGKHRESLVTGVELMDRMCELAGRKGSTVYFFGGWGDRAKRTAEYFQKKYPKLKVAGFKEEDFDMETKADFLFVARGMKKQERWIEEHLDKLRVKVVMGVGRSFDYYSGDLKRAPEGFRKMGLEWLYSLYKEPKRWRRQLALPRFIWKVLTS